MALFDKLSDLAKNITEKTTDAIETGKLTNKINSEKNLAGEELKKIGAFYYEKYVESGEAAPEVLEFCESAKAHYDAADEAQAEIDRIRAESEAAKAAAAVSEPVSSAPFGNICPECGKENGEGVKFCGGCGTKLITAEQPAVKYCPGCGKEVSADVRFCGECGTRM